MKFKEFGKVLMDKAHQYSPEILTGIGVSGFFTAIIFGIKATPTACALIEERKLDEGKDELTKREVVETVWKCYIPTAVTSMASAACIIGAAAENHSRNAALAAAYSVTQETLSIYRQKVVETLGEKKELAIREKADEERIKRHEKLFVNHEISLPGDMPCVDELSGAIFESNWTKIKKAVDELNDEMDSNPFDPTVELADYYYKVGIRNRGIGEAIWDKTIDGRIELNLPTCIELDDGRIAMVVSFKNPPRYVQYD